MKSTEIKEESLNQDTMQEEQKDQNLFIRMLSKLDWTKYAMVIILIILGVAFHFMTNGIFITPRNLSTLMRQVAVLGVAASGMTMLLIMGQIDLSMGSSMYLVSVISAAAIVDFNLPMALGLLAAIGAGVLIGIWQGMWVSRFNVPAFIVTLAGLLAWRGLGNVYTGGATVGPVSKAYQAISNQFIPPVPSYIAIGAAFLIYVVFTVLKSRDSSLKTESFGQRALKLVGNIIIAGIVLFFFAWFMGQYRGIPTAVLVLIGVIGALTFVSTKTVFGRRLYAIGSNKEAAALAGINIKKHIFIGFIIMGGVYGIAGILTVARLSGAVSSGGMNLELDAIAAAVIGGTSLAGGIGTVPGAILGALVLSVVDNGMSLMNISSFWQMVVKGELLLLAVLFDVYSTRKRRF